MTNKKIEPAGGSDPAGQEDFTAAYEVEAETPASGESPENPGPAAATDPLTGELTAARAQAGEYYERLVRLQADFENYKRRVRNEREEIGAYANETLIVNLLPVIDNLERALVSASQSSDLPTLMDGLQLVLRQLAGVLEKEGVKPIQALDSCFNPVEHHAVMQVADTGKAENTVVLELQKGYRLKERVIRPSMVGVATNNQEI